MEINTKCRQNQNELYVSSWYLLQFISPETIRLTVHKEKKAN